MKEFEVSSSIVTCITVIFFIFYFCSTQLSIVGVSVDVAGPKAFFFVFRSSNAAVGVPDGEPREPLVFGADRFGSVLFCEHVVAQTRLRGRAAAQRGFLRFCFIGNTVFFFCFCFFLQV